MGTAHSAVSEIKFIQPLNHMDVETGWDSKDLKDNPSVKLPGSLHLRDKTVRKLGQRQTSVCQLLLHEMKTPECMSGKTSSFQGEEIFKTFGFIHNKI